MKFTNKKIIFTTFVIAVFITVMGILQSCGNDSEVTSNTNQIGISDLPLGVTPIKVNSRAEMNNTIDRIKQADVVKSQTLSNKNGINKNYQIRIKVYNNTLLEKNTDLNALKRFKAPPVEDVKRDDASMFYDVNISFKYDQQGGKVTTTSHSEGFTYGQTWTQLSTTEATWNSDNTMINYTVKGTITYYFLIPGTGMIEVYNRDVILKGSTPCN